MDDDEIEILDFDLESSTLFNKRRK